jgi:hypothetical protein
VHFFCSSDCQERYFKAKVGTLMFGSDTFIVNATDQDISGMIASGRAMAERATAHCWSCGAVVPMAADECGSCGTEQEIEL